MAASLQFRLTGGSSNTNPNASLGGVMSSVQISATALNNLFDNVQPDEASAGESEYRALDLYNAGDTPATSVEVYTSIQTTSPDSLVDIGYDVSAGSHQTNANLETVANEDTAPSSPSITLAQRLVGSELSLPDIAVGQAVRVWFRRVISPGAANISNDSFTFNAKYA